MSDKTIQFSIRDDHINKNKQILHSVYDALVEKGYNPTSQIVGYLLSEDPTYITTHNNARSLIRQIDRDELLQELVEQYLKSWFWKEFNLSKFLEYKGKPLVRSGNTLYYGNMKDPYVCMLQILSEKELHNEKVADKVAVTLLNTDPSIPPTEAIVKRSEQTGIFNAVDIAALWLEKMLK